MPRTALQTVAVQRGAGTTPRKRVMADYTAHADNDARIPETTKRALDAASEERISDGTHEEQTR